MLICSVNKASVRSWTLEISWSVRREELTNSSAADREVKPLLTLGSAIVQTAYIGRCSGNTMVPENRGKPGQQCASLVFEQLLLHYGATEDKVSNPKSAAAAGRLVTSGVHHCPHYYSAQ